jgi:hypothetical protein
MGTIRGIVERGNYSHAVSELIDYALYVSKKPLSFPLVSRQPYHANYENVAYISADEVARLKALKVMTHTIPKSYFLDGDKYGNRGEYFQAAPTDGTPVKPLWTYDEASDMVKIMVFAYKKAISVVKALGLKKTPLLIRNPKSESFTDGEKIVVSTDYFSVLQADASIAVFIGLAAHEASHIAFTDFVMHKAKLDEFQKKYEPLVGAAGAATLTKLGGILFNIIEDERIETALVQEIPTISYYLKEVKQFYFGTEVPDMVQTLEIETAAGATITGLPKSPIGLIETFLKWVRYPQTIDPYLVGAFYPSLTWIKSWYEIPTTSSEVWDCAEKILHYVFENFSTSAVDEAVKQFSSDTSKPDLVAGKSAHDSRMSACIRKGLRIHTDKVCNSSTSGVEAKGDLVEKVLEQIEAEGNDGEIDDSDEDDEVFTEDEKGSKEGKISKRSLKIIYDKEGSINKFGGKIVDTKVAPNKTIYDKLRYKYLLQIAQLKKTLITRQSDYSKIVFSQRSGKLAQVAEAVAGSITPFTVVEPIRKTPVKVCLLIDESGSMGGRNIEAARDLAVILKETFGNECYAYGHTTSGEDVVIRDYNKDRTTLGSVEAHCANRDGTAIAETYRRARKRAGSDFLLMIVLSDGQPSASGYYGMEAIRHVRDVVSCIETDPNGSIMQIAIGRDVPSEAMFKNFVTFVDMATFPAKVAKLVNKIIQTHC